MKLHSALDRQSLFLIQSCRGLMSTAMSLDPQTCDLDPEKLIARLEGMRHEMKKLSKAVTAVKTNAATVRRQRAGKAAA